MTRDEAVERINDGIGFRATGHSLTQKIINRLQEAQRNLQNGKTLPRFLLQEDQPLALAAAASTATLPTDFIRPSDSSPLHFTPEGTDLPFYLSNKREHIDAVLANIRSSNEAIAPSVYVIRKTTIDFITTADQAYALTWDYYKKATVLATNVENEWLADDAGSEWLIGEAGLRIARDLRDKDAVEIFSAMQLSGRAACFGEILAFEDAGGPIIMGLEN